MLIAYQVLGIIGGGQLSTANCRQPDDSNGCHVQLVRACGIHNVTYVHGSITVAWPLPVGGNIVPGTWYLVPKEGPVKHVYL